MTRIVLVIAGFDPSSGAGVTADVQTLAAHGCYGVACITALTVQNTRGVQRVVALTPKLLRETLHSLNADFEFAAVKIGMLGSPAIAREVLRFLQERRPANVVLDPVLRSSSGAALLDSGGLAVMRKMLPLAEVITPNVAEAAALAQVNMKTSKDLRRAAARLHELGAKNVLITGGDSNFKRRETVDWLFTNAGEVQEFAAPKLISRSTHGTGCAFSSALAAQLALGTPLPKAVAEAKAYVIEAIRSAPAIGHGKGPLNLRRNNER